MSLPNDVIAALALACVFPGVLFLTSLLVRQSTPPTATPARTAERVVTWYAAHPQLGLWVLLLLLPFSAFVVGISTLSRTWAENAQLRDQTWRVLGTVAAHVPAELVGLATVVSGCILLMMTNQLARADARPTPPAR